MVCTIRLASIDDLKPAVQLLSQCMQQNAHPPLVANVIKQLGENNVQERANLKAKFGALLDDSLNMALDNANTYHARSFRKQWSRSMPQDAAIFFCEHDSQQQHLERFFHESEFARREDTCSSFD